MTRFLHDQFAKDYLKELLKNYGSVNTSEKVSTEIKEIDVLFIPTQPPQAEIQVLGLLSRFAEFPMILEPFRNPASEDEICDCLLKLLEVRASMRREAKAKKRKLPKHQIPKLWILTPTASSDKLSSFNINQKPGWLPRIYFLGGALRAAIVVIHQLPATPETLWLRLLGRGQVQEQAILELAGLPSDHPYQQATLELVYDLRENLRVNRDINKDDRELIMRLEPLYQRHREQAKEEGRIEGRQEGRLEGEQRLVMRQLNRLFGEIDASLTQQIRELSPEQLEALGEVLLDFCEVADLQTWLNQTQA
ncbi:DUF4351 domain-containing protein [Scytonema sp. UIC 10036]|uniref:DUF4351 domain-containing protein n=1 Tax=Scytonema sp. UIC 10036 TaxID=2304196 RepID=UPI0012DA7FA3|nr:DUF4351 domain-containing protein [Scytonema sp. UIC 10036]MUG95991.1 DUF4351 domain-containing protein [Scytonema sp. UIC 10036]